MTEKTTKASIKAVNIEVLEVGRKGFMGRRGVKLRIGGLYDKQGIEKNIDIHMVTGDTMTILVGKKAISQKKK